MQTGLEEAIAEAGSHIGQIQCGRTRATHAGGLLHHVGEHLHELAVVLTRTEREAGGDQAVGHADALADADAAIVQEGTTATRGGEQVVAAGIVDHRLLHLAAHGERNAHAIDRETVDEVGGAIERVDVPDEIAVGIAMRLTGFFGKETVLRVGGMEDIDDGVFGLLVHFGHIVIDLLLAHADGLDVQGGTVDDGASGARSLDGHIEHGVQGR